MTAYDRAWQRLKRCPGYQFQHQLWEQERRFHGLEKTSRILERSLNSPARGPRRALVPRLLDRLRRQSIDLERDTLAFALELPVECFAEYRAKKRELVAYERALNSLPAKTALADVGPTLDALRDFYEWLFKRAEDYRRPWLEDAYRLMSNLPRPPARRLA